MKKILVMALVITILSAIAMPMAIGAAPTEIEFSGIEVTATIERLQEDENELTIVVTNGQASITDRFLIDDNASGTFRLGSAEVGFYDVFVNTQGNPQISEIYITSFNPPAYSGRIDSRVIQGAEVFVYIPDGIVLDRWTAPIILVYGDVPFTEDSAMRTALTSGLAAIASRENACIAFINPIGDGWSEADLATHRALIQNVFMERPATTGANAWYNGVTPQGRYQGFLFRVVAVAGGTGADFANEHLISDSLFITAGAPNNHKMPASVMLFNGGTAPTARAGEFGQEWPAVIVNGTSAANDAFVALNPGGRVSIQNSAVNSGFDAAVLLQGYNDVAGNVLRMQFRHYGVLADAPQFSNIGIVDIPNYDALDVEVTSNWFTIRNNADTADLNMMYLRHIPNNLDRTPGNIPVVFGFHGMGERAEYYAMLSGWAAIGAREGFMTIMLCQHLSINDARNMEFINMVLDRYDFIDRSRVYMTGFSMGGMRAFNVGGRNPDVFAAISPWASIPNNWAPALTETFPDEYILPIIYFVGHHDFLGNATWPNSNNTAIRHFFDINGNVPYVFDITLGTFSSGMPGRWGIDNPDYERYVDVLGGTAQTRIWYFDNQESGGRFTALGDTTNMGHVITNYDSELAWAFMSQFARAADGSIIISDYPAESYRWYGTAPTRLEWLFEDESDIILATRGNLGIGAQHSPFVIPYGVTLTIETVLNISRDAWVVVEGTLIIPEGGRVNLQSNGSIRVADTGVLTVAGTLESVASPNAHFVNDGRVTIADTGRVTVRAQVRHCLDDVGTLTNNGSLTIHRDAVEFVRD